MCQESSVVVGLLARAGVHVNLPMNYAVFGVQDKKTSPAYGADVLRLWVAQSGTDPRVHIGPNLLNACHERLFKVIRLNYVGFSVRRFHISCNFQLF